MPVWGMGQLFAREPSDGHVLVLCRSAADQSRCMAGDPADMVHPLESRAENSTERAEHAKDTGKRAQEYDRSPSRQSTAPAPRPATHRGRVAATNPKYAGRWAAGSPQLHRAVAVCPRHRDRSSAHSGRRYPRTGYTSRVLESSICQSSSAVSIDGRFDSLIRPFSTAT
jgi:hypothetical protein